MTERQVVSRTFFMRSKENDEWYWHTKALNNEIIAAGGEGYKRLRDAVHGFYVSQGVTVKDDEFFSDVEGFQAVQVSTSRFQINKLTPQ